MFGTIIEKMKVPHEYEAERITKGHMSARACRVVRSVGSSVRQSNQEEVATGRGPARAEEDRGTGQGTSGVVKKPVAPVAYQIILEPGIGQFREFESPRVHTRINSWELFLVHKLTCGKRESVS